MIMKTPIYDFVKEYAERTPSRFHMPGHKGKSFLGMESFDVTEISGADTLYSADGIIAESEENASRIFDTAHTFYSTEGSTLAIKAMLAIATLGKRNPRILAARGAHKALIHAAALLDLDIRWLYPDSPEHVCSQLTTPNAVRAALSYDSSVCAVYITSPDYLGNISDIEGISSVCKEYGVPLLVDNAHGAYLNFLSPSRHPIALGADMCCDSAHKTLPVLTGGAYLHISRSAKREYIDSARNMLSVFASTSPSYLILESLDLCNRYLSGTYRDSLALTVSRIEKLKAQIMSLGYNVLPTEPLKIVISTAEYGYTGADIANILSQNNIEIEFFDDEFIVLMATPENEDSDYERLINTLSAIESRTPAVTQDYENVIAERAISIREAVFARRESVSPDMALGRICASPTVSCPPAVPIVVSGEIISETAVKMLKKYHIEKIEVVKND